MATTPRRAVASLSRPHADVVVAAPVADRGDYGGLVTRALAAAIDAAIIDLVALAVAAVVALILSIFPVGHDTKTLLAALGGAAFVIWAAAYFVTFWSTTGQTPGDRVMRLRVVRLDATPLKPARALLRLAGAVLGLVLLLGYVPILFTAHRRAAHDFLAGTVVIAWQAPPTRGNAP